MEKRRVVITGLGTVNPTGNSVAESWAAVRRGQCGVGPITQYDTSNSKVKLAAEVKDFDPTRRIDKREARKMARFTQFAVAAAAEAIEDAGLDLEHADLTRCATVISSGIGGLPIMEEECLKGEAKGYDRVSPFFVPMTIANMAAGQVAIRFGLKGMCTSPLGVGGFTSMKALNPTDDPARASIPFDAERGGFVIGEGAGILVLEELEHARARGAHIYAEVVGYASNCDAYHFTAPAPGGAGGAACMRLALEDAGVQPESIGYINAHGTGTHLNDSCETAAIKTVFGEHAYKLAVSSTKSMTGHLLGAAGGVEGVFTALALHDGYLPATVNLKVPDPECDLNYLPNQGVERRVDYALSDSLGFGGHNACVVFKRWEG